MTVLLVHPYFIQPLLAGGTSQATHPPMAICYLSAFLKAKDIAVYGIDLNLDPEEELFKIIETKKIQIVGFSSITATFHTSHAIAKKVKQRHPHLKIIFGGMPIELFTETLGERTIDVIVLGEGEETLLELVKHYLMDSPRLLDIPGIAFYKKGQLIRTEKRANPISLDNLPYPDRDLIDPKRYLNPFHQQCYITTSRSCPHKCVYCLSGTLSNTFRTRSIEGVIDEIKHIKKTYPFYEKFLFIDETLNASPTRFKNLCKALKEEKIKWSGNIKPDHTVDAETIQMMRDSGAVMFEIGLESGNQEILNKINKKTTLTNIENILKKAHELEMPVIGTVMVPHYCDTPATLKDTVAFIKKCAEAYSLIPFIIQTAVHPGSYFSTLIAEYELLTLPAYEIIQTKHLTKGNIVETIQLLEQIKAKAYEKNAMNLIKTTSIDINNFDPAILSKIYL